MKRIVLASDIATPRDRLPSQRAPLEGETVVNCGHGRRAPLMSEPDSKRNPAGWFEYINPETGRTGITISGPKGQVEARWLSCCAACLRAAAGDPRRVVIRSHFAFAGLAPSSQLS